MNLIGVTGKTGAGKTYFATKLEEKIENSSVINVDKIFSEVMNNEVIISKIYAIYGDEVIINGKVDLDTILINKTIFDTIYEMIAKKLEEYLSKEIEQNYLERKRKSNNRLVGTT